MELPKHRRFTAYKIEGEYFHVLELAIVDMFARQMLNKTFCSSIMKKMRNILKVFVEATNEMASRRRKMALEAPQTVLRRRWLC